MARKDVRVNLPVGKPEPTLKLCKRILEKHTTLGGASPLVGFFDMTDFATKITDCIALRASAKVKEGETQALYKDSELLCGIAEGQNKETKDTLYTWILAIRDFLLVKFRANPEMLSEWGFEVVISQTGGRRNVRIDIPDNSIPLLLELCDAIILKTASDDTLEDSPVNMSDFTDKTNEAQTLFDAAEELRDAKEAEFGDALALMGYAEGQTSLTPGTLYFYITGIRDRLLNVEEGHEERLSTWGYDVVIGETSPPGPPAGDAPTE